MGNCFYFISDQYFRDFTDPNLMKNSEVIGDVLHGRPCFYTFPDPHHKILHWCVPISSKVSKYQEVYNSKLEKYGFAIRNASVMSWVIQKHFLFKICSLLLDTTSFPFTKIYSAAVT